MPAWGRKGRWITGGVLAVVFLFCGAVILNQKITGWVDSKGFQDMLDKETSKGLKFEGAYSPLTRTSLFGMHADSFDGKNGIKTIVALHADDISGYFNPLGVGLHRWQLDDIHIKSGWVMLQKTEPKPGEPKGPTPMPWWGLFWPYHVYLTDVKVDSADVLWHLRDKESGIHHTFLEITPNGRDFEYDGRGGTLETPITPSLEVRHAHLLVRKPRLYCSEFLLGDDDAHPDQTARIIGDAGLQDDRSMHLTLDLNALNVSPWMPEKLRAHVRGNASGHFTYTSTGTGLEGSTADGTLTVINGILHELAPIRQYVTVTGSPDPGDLTLKTCRADIHWKDGSLSTQNIEVECAGVFKLIGSLTVAADKSLSGTVDLGLTDPYIKWLPTAKQTIFTRQDGNYFFTTIHFWGTAQKPQQDLSVRVMKEVEKSPLLALKLFFNQAGEWFNFD